MEAAARAVSVISVYTEMANECVMCIDFCLIFFAIGGPRLENGRGTQALASWRVPGIRSQMQKKNVVYCTFASEADRVLKLGGSTKLLGYFRLQRKWR